MVLFRFHLFSYQFSWATDRLVSYFTCVRFLVSCAKLLPYFQLSQQVQCNPLLDWGLNGANRSPSTLSFVFLFLYSRQSYCAGIDECVDVFHSSCNLSWERLIRFATIGLPKKTILELMNRQLDGKNSPNKKETFKSVTNIVKPICRYNKQQFDLSTATATLRINPNRSIWTSVRMQLNCQELY